MVFAAAACSCFRRWVACSGSFRANVGCAANASRATEPGAIGASELARPVAWLDDGPVRLGPLLTLRLVHNSGIGLLVPFTEGRATQDESVLYDRSDTTQETT